MKIAPTVIISYHQLLEHRNPPLNILSANLFQKQMAWRNRILKETLFDSGNPLRSVIRIEHLMIRSGFEKAFIYRQFFLGNIFVLIVKEMEHWYGYECGYKPIALFKRRVMRKIDHTLEFTPPLSYILKQSPIVLAALTLDFHGYAQKCNGCRKCIIKVLALEENTLEGTCCLKQDFVERPRFNMSASYANLVLYKHLPSKVTFKNRINKLKRKCSRLSISE